MESPDSAELVQRLQADDPSALEAIYQRLAGRCNAVAFAVLHNDQGAADAVQDAFLSLWQHRHGLVVRSAGIAPWLLVVTRNAALTMLRRETARAQREGRSGMPQDIDPAPDPSHAIASEAQSIELKTAMNRLPAEQLRVLQLAYFGFMTLAQIAERTNTPLGTVKRRAQRALQQLNSFMTRQPI